MRRLDRGGLGKVERNELLHVLVMEREKVATASSPTTATWLWYYYDNNTTDININCYYGLLTMIDG